MPFEIKILTYNIHKGLNWNNSILTISKIKDALKASHADIVFLQEVVGKHQKYALKHLDWVDNQFEYLADTIWSDFAYAKNAVYDKRDHGNAILSRYPIKRWEQIDISTNRFEQRGVLFCEIEHPDGLMHVYCVHLNLLHFDRKKQYEQIIKLVQANSQDHIPQIIAGDFNDWNQHACAQIEGRLNFKEAFKGLNGSYPRTFPSAFPTFSLDRIYIKNMNPINAQVFTHSPWKDLSDHAPIYLECQGSTDEERE